MIRVVLALVPIALIAGIAVFFSDRPGTVTILWQGWSVELGVGTAVIFLIVASGILAVSWRLGTWLAGAPSRAARARTARRQHQGWTAITRGLVAIAAGDAREAMRQHDLALRLFAPGRSPVRIPPLARLIEGQAALLRGDEAAAHAAFETMRGDPETEFLGLRGLILLAERQGDAPAALALTGAARALRPKAGWVLHNQLALEARTGAWAAAEATLRTAGRRKLVEQGEVPRLRAVLLVARSRAAAEDDRPRDALAYARKAYRSMPSLVPAAATYARALGAAGKPRRAMQVLERAWRETPHPALAAACEAAHAAETPAGRYRKVAALLALHPGERSGELAAATAALHARLWGEARRHLAAIGVADQEPRSSMPAGAAAPSAAWRVLAAVEAGEHGDGEAAARARARADAPRDPHWQCGDCGARNAEWEPVCPECRSLGSFTWVTEPERTAPMTRAAAVSRSPDPLHAHAAPTPPTQGGPKPAVQQTTTKRSGLGWLLRARTLLGTG